MKTYTRKATMVDLKNYCHLAKEHDYIEVCEWSNGEGLDISTKDRNFQLSWGELEAINVLAHYKG